MSTRKGAAADFPRLGWATKMGKESGLALQRIDVLTENQAALVKAGAELIRRHGCEVSIQASGSGWLRVGEKSCDACRKLADAIVASRVRVNLAREDAVPQWTAKKEETT